MKRWLRACVRRLGSPLGVTLTYLAFGLAWISVSDPVLEQFASERVSVTSLQTYKGWIYVCATALLLYGLSVNMAARLMETRGRLRQTHQKLLQLIESSNDGIWVVDPAGKVVMANSRLLNILGVSRQVIMDRGVESFFLPDSLPPAGAGSPEHARDSSRIVRFRRPGDNDHRGWAIISRIALADGDGDADGELLVLSDITRTKNAEQALRTSLNAERTLLNELDHRVRNNLASLMTLVDMTRQSASSVKEFATMIRGRVGAMAATHSLLAESKFASVDLGRLLTVIIEGEQEQRLERQGPPLTLGPSQAGPIAMILQELWSNSVKHGALGTDHGRVRVRWSESSPGPGHRTINLTWKDMDGPPVLPPDRVGFGLSLVNGLCRSDLRGRFDAAFEPDGARFDLEFPAPEPLPET